MEKIWLKEYPPGVKDEVNAKAYKSIVEVMEVSCRKFGGKPAFTNMGADLSFKDVERLSGHFAAYLKHELKLKKGDRVAVMMPNLLQYPIAVFGILRAGLVVVNVNPLYTARELEHQLEDSGARAILVVENFARTLAKIVDKTRVEKVIITQIGDMLPGPKRLLTNLVVKHVKKMVPEWEIADTDNFRAALDKGAKFQSEEVGLTQDDIAFLQYTGGTTGLSKGAVLSHGNLVANMQQATAWFAQNLDDSGGEIVITALPLYHIFALTVNCLMFFKLGGQNVLITNPRDMPGFVKELGKHEFSVITGVNTLFNGLLNTPGFSDLDFSHLKVSVGGGMAVQRPVAEEWKKVTGKPLIEGYGLTETAPMATANRLDMEDYNSSIGVPIPMTEAVIRDDDNNDVSVGEPGELCIRGPQVMQGYWQKPEENAKVFTEDGFLRTGDIATMDENGYFYIVDRKKDMILVSGFNVFPNEIEEVVASHPGVLEAACVGVPDEKSVEAVKVFVVKKDAGINKDDVVAHCREHLTGYKVPKHVEFRDELPKSNVGKILRKELR